MKTLLTSVALAMLCATFAATANAQFMTIHESDFESEPTLGFGVASSTLGFNDAGGDLIGFTNNGGAGTTGDALGVSDRNPFSGSFHYAVDAGATSAASGNNWGASWNGISSINNNSSGGFTTQADAEAMGGRYIDYSEGATFIASAFVATDDADALAGSATAAVRLEVYYSIDNNGDGIEDFASELGSLPRPQGNTFGAGDLTTTYAESSVSYTLTAADVDFANLGNPAGADGMLGTADDETVLGINRVVGVLGTDGHGHGNTDGLIFYDDFTFQVSSANVIEVAAIPEPSTAGLLLAGLMGLCGVRRRKI